MIDAARNLSVWLFNTHLPYTPYQPFQLLGIPYMDNPFLETEEQAVASAASTRDTHIQSVLADMRQSVVAEGALLMLTGDFNEPSPHDWTDSSVIAGV